MSKGYTALWTQNFQRGDVIKYHEKWQNRFEKSLKHVDLVEFVEKYVPADGIWLDFPIGSGRLFDELSNRCRRAVGADISPEFLRFNREKGYDVTPLDLTNFSLAEQYDLVTNTNTLFAFPNAKEILARQFAGVRPGGRLIFTIHNRPHLLRFLRFLPKPPTEYGAMSRDEVEAFARKLGGQLREIKSHDGLDNVVFDWLLRGRRAAVTGRLHRLINIIYFRSGLARSLLRALYRRVPEVLCMQFLVCIEKPVEKKDLR